MERPVTTPPRSRLFSGAPLARADRVAVAVLVALGAGLAAFLTMYLRPETAAKDFTYPWRAARALLAGLNPYDVIVPTGRYPFESRFPYPLPAALAAFPLAGLAAVPAAGVFIGASSGLLAWALTRDGLWRFWMFASAPFMMVLVLGQWPPLLMAGTLLPWLAFALVLKPTLGFALFAWRPSSRVAVAGAALTVASLTVLPTWPADWLRVTREVTGHPAPVTWPFGWIPLLALLRWRQPEARLVAAMACVPQNPYFYDQLPLWFAAWDGRTAALLSALSWAAYAGTKATCSDAYFCGTEAEPWVQWLLYVPATAMVLARGRSLPSWLRRPSSPALDG